MKDVNKYIDLLFNKDEYAGMGNIAATNGVYPVEKALKDKWSFITLNPLHAETTRADSAVSSFRNFLIEMDFGTTEEQFEYIHTLGIPYSCATSSGKKSIHFIVALEESLKNETEWRKYAKTILEIYKYADQSTKNPSRYTRLAGALRAETRQVQKLLQINSRISKLNLDNWLSSHEKSIKIESELTSALLNTGMKKILFQDTKDFLINGAPVGTINNRSYSAAINLLECGYSFEYTKHVMLKTADKYGYNSNEIFKTIKSAVNKLKRS